jgi:hypothetical protein
VGKTFAMLGEGFRRRSRGTDVVIGFVETYGRAATEAQIRDLPVIPRKQLAYRGRLLEEMNLEITSPSRSGRASLSRGSPRSCERPHAICDCRSMGSQSTSLPDASRSMAMRSI